MVKKVFISIIKIVAWISLMFGMQVLGMFIAVFLMSRFGILNDGSMNVLINAFGPEFSYNNISSEVLYLLGEISNYCIIISFIPYIFIILKNFNKHYRKISFKTFSLLIGIGILANFLISLILVLLIPFISSGLLNDYNVSTGLASNGNILLTIISTGLIAPIIEEITLRRGVYRVLKDFCPVKIAMLIQAVLFGIMHGNLIQGIYATLLGFIFCVFYEKSKENLLVPTILHITINMTSVLLTMLV